MSAEARTLAATRTIVAALSAAEISASPESDSGNVADAYSFDVTIEGRSYNVEVAASVDDDAVDCSRCGATYDETRLPEVRR